MKVVKYTFHLTLILLIAISTSSYGQKMDSVRNRDFMKVNRSVLLNCYGFKPATSFSYSKPDSLGIISFAPSFHWKNNLFANRLNPAIDKNMYAFSFPKKSSSVLWFNEPKLIFEYNNGNGANIYKSLIDGMAIVMPDKTFKSNILVLKPR